MKKLGKFLKLFLIALGLTILVFLILMPQLIKANPDITFDGDKFYKMDLDRICGVELREREEDYCGETCTRYWNNRNIETKFDDLSFYLFDSNRSAKKAYKEIEKVSKDVTLEKGNDYLIAEEIGTIDASCTNLYYIHNNLIIKVCIYSVSEMAMDMDADPNDYVYKLDKDEVLKLIRDNF